MNFWIKLVLLLLVNLEFFTIHSILFGEEGVLHLRFVRMVEKDGRRGDKNQPLYFISHELEYLRNMSRLERHENWESIKRQAYSGLLISKVATFNEILNNFTSLGWFGCLLLPQLVFIPDMVEAYFQPELSRFLQTNEKEQDLAKGNSSSRFRAFEMTRFLAFITTSTLTSILLPFCTANQELWNEGGALKRIYMASINNSSFHILAVALACKAISCCPESLATASLFLDLPKVPLASSCVATLFLSSTKMPVILGVAFIWALVRKSSSAIRYDNICHFAQLMAILYSSIFSTFRFDLLDVIFGVALIFLHKVGKYRPGAVKLADMFSFLYLQVILLATLTMMFNLERFNFTETEVLWNQFPSLMKDLNLKVLVYLALITLFLSGIQHVRLLFDDPHAPEKHTLEYESSVMTNFIFRDYFQMVPADSITKRNIEVVNGRNLLGLFILANLYFYQSWTSLFVNLGFAMFAEQMAPPFTSSLRSLNLAIQLSKFLLRFSKPLHLFALRQAIWIAEEMSLDERFLRLLFFDVSHLGKHSQCRSNLPFFDASRWEQQISCGLSSSWPFIVGYVTVGLHILTVPIVLCLKRKPNSVSLVADFSMVFQEVTLITLLTAGLCFGFYIDLLLISSSVYMLLSSRRVGFEAFS